MISDASLTLVTVWAHKCLIMEIIATICSIVGKLNKIKYMMSWQCLVCDRHITIPLGRRRDHVSAQHCLHSRYQSTHSGRDFYRPHTSSSWNRKEENLQLNSLPLLPPKDMLAPPGHWRWKEVKARLGGPLWRPQDWALPGLTAGCSSEACSGCSNSTSSHAWTAAHAQAPRRMLLWPVGSSWSPHPAKRENVKTEMITKGLGLLERPLMWIRNRKEEKRVAEHFPRWKKSPMQPQRQAKGEGNLYFKAPKEYVTASELRCSSLFGLSWFAQQPCELSIFYRY